MVLTIGGPATGLAQTAGGPAQPASAGDADALAKQTQNPVSSLISVPLQANWDFGLGDRGATGTLFNIQPVMPFGITRSTNVILRVIMPLASQPAADGARVNGLGDVVATAFFSPANSGRIIWGAGPVFLLPAATEPASGGLPSFRVGSHGSQEEGRRRRGPGPGAFQGGTVRRRHLGGGVTDVGLAGRGTMHR